jgi:hypothetical protein
MSQNYPLFSLQRPFLCFKNHQCFCFSGICFCPSGDHPLEKCRKSGDHCLENLAKSGFKKT